MNPFNDEETVIIGVYNDAAEANAAKSKLDTEGIMSMLVDENAVGLNPLGGIELKILSRDVDRAKELLAN